MATWASAWSPSGMPRKWAVCCAAMACSSALGSARPMSSMAMRTRRRAMYRRSSPASSIRASQYKAASASEGRILGRRTDQDYVALLDVGQKRILLGFVEAMNFVDEDHRATAHPARPLGVGHHSLDFLDAAEHGAEWDELAMRHTRDDPGQR